MALNGYRLFIWDDRESMLDGCEDPLTSNPPITADFKNIEDVIHVAMALVEAGKPIAIDRQEVC